MGDLGTQCLQLTYEGRQCVDKALAPTESALAEHLAPEEDCRTPGHPES